MPLDLDKVKGLCFDIDGTISDTDNEYVYRITRFLSPLEQLVKRKRIHTFARWLVMFSESPMNSIYYGLDVLSLDDHFASLFDRIMRRKADVRSHFLLMSGAKELLETASQHYSLCVISARDERTTGEFLQRYGLRDHFLEVVTNLTCEHTKPFAQPVVYAAQHMNLSPQECLMIGDTTVDILAGKRAGAQTAGLLCGFGTERELRRAGADVIVKDLHELRKLLFQS